MWQSETDKQVDSTYGIHNEQFHTDNYTEFKNGISSENFHTIYTDQVISEIMNGQLAVTIDNVEYTILDKQVYRKHNGMWIKALRFANPEQLKQYLQNGNMNN